MAVSIVSQLRNANIPEHLLDQMEGPRPPDDFVSNGCSWSPDYVSGIDLRPAGHLHDWSYLIHGTEAEREKDDYAFYRNLRACGAPAVLAGVYFRRVRLLGIGHFCYEPPLTRWQEAWLYVRCFFTRYVRW